jgi:hypothetical protein
MITRPAALLLLGTLSAGCMLGEIDDHAIVHRAHVDDDRIGHSKAFPTVLRVPVGPEPTGGMAEVGRLAHEALFPTYPPFAVNVAFACGQTQLLTGRGPYANPRSIWYNVFFGFYEIDAPRSEWKRPFGYRLTDRGPEVDFEDVIRLGKADWNYFSNHVYGVPIEAIRPHDTVDMRTMRTVNHGRQRIGERWWDVIELWGMTVVSPYEAARDRHTLQETFPVLTRVWRGAFGLSEADDAFPRSFFPTRIHAKMYVSFTEGHDGKRGEEIYETFVFGGTVNEDYKDQAENARFLDLQMASLRGLIINHGQGMGFVSER